MIIDRRRVLLFAAATAATFAIPGAVLRPVYAAADENGERPFTQAAFDAAQKAGKPILVDTFATWCPICGRQAPIIEKLSAEPKYKGLVIFRVNFDTQKDVMRQLHATVQSTLIAYRGNKEVGRSVGETQPEWIEDLLDKTRGNTSS